MKEKYKELLKNWRVIIFLGFIILAIVAIHPVPWAKGLSVRSISPNSSAMESGFIQAKQTLPPASRERVLSVDGIEVNTIEEYENAFKEINANQTIPIVTNQKQYWVTIRPIINITTTAEKINQTREEIVEKTINKTKVNVTVNKTYEVPKMKEEIIGKEDIGLRLEPAAKTNLRKGLDLQGGTRVILQPEEKLEQTDFDTVIESLKERLNVFGLSDITVRSAVDLEANQFIIVEIAGATEEDVRELLSKQGKFEAKIANKTVFKGGNDITYVCRTADCSGIDAREGGCGSSGDGYACRFAFSITLNPEAAKRQADATRTVPVEPGQPGQRYLTEPIILYLDDREVDRLNIAEDLKGRAVTDISISGSGSGRTKNEAAENTLQNMKRLQTILITGSLPVKLNIIDMETISPALGKGFAQSALLAGIGAVFAVAIVVFLRYRMLIISIPIMITCLAEIIMLLGFAALVGWNLDLAAIAGIIISIGTAVDHQIIITDETLRNHGKEYVDWKKRFKNAMFIIIVAFFTTSSSMVPLYFAGAGILKMFALTTLAGIFIGVFITRPVFAAMIQTLLKTE